MYTGGNTGMYMAVLTVIVKKEEPYKVMDAIIYE